MFEHYYNELIGYFSYLLKDRDRAHDVVHECYSRVLASSAERPIKEPRAFLYRTVRNIIIDEHRRGKHHANINIDDAQRVADTEPHSLELALAQERMQRLQETIDALPPRCKEAFTLFKFEGLSHIQIAQRMGISKNMVEKHIILGMKMCRKCLEEIE